MMQDQDTRPMKAAAFMMGAMIIIGFIDNFVATIAETISVWQFLFVRMVLSVPVVLGLSALGLGSVWPKRLGAVTIRSLFVAFGMFCYFSALAFMPIAMALAGLFTSPIFVLLITAFVLRQRIGPWRIGAVALGFAGILVVLGPSGDALGWILMLPVLGGALYASGAVATRVLCEGETTISLLMGIFLAQGTIGAIALVVIEVVQPEVGVGGLAFLTRGWVWDMGAVWPYLALQVIGSVIGVGLLNRSYQVGEASQVAVFEYSVMIFGPFFGWWLLGHPVSAMQGVGIAMIACAGILIAVRSRG